MVLPPLQLTPEEVQALDALLRRWRRIAATPAKEARERRAVATGVDDVISLCETAIAKLQEAAATLLQEPADAAETTYGPGPLAGAIVAAGDLVHNTFNYPDPDCGPLQAALRDLGSVIHVNHAAAYNHFTAYAEALGFIPGDLWDSNHALVKAQARVARQWLIAAEEESLAAEVAIRLCEDECKERPPLRGRMAAAELRLQQAISRAGKALVVLRAMRDTLMELEQIVAIATSQALPPP